MIEKPDENISVKLAGFIHIVDKTDETPKTILKQNIQLTSENGMMHRIEKDGSK